MRALLILLTTLCLTACPPRPEPLTEEDGGMLGPPLWPEGALTFGTTDDDGELFETIGPALTLHRGPQGGNHAYAKYQVTGQVAKEAVFENRVRRARDGVLVSRGMRILDVTIPDAGSWKSDGSIVMFLCPTAPGINIVGEPLVFEVTAKSATGKFLGRASVTSKLTCTGCEADCGG